MKQPSELLDFSEGFEGWREAFVGVIGANAIGSIDGSTLTDSLAEAFCGDLAWRCTLIG